MEIRIHRSFQWVPRPDGRIGGTPDLILGVRDALEVKVDGEWKEVPLVEDEKPPHPDEVARQKSVEGARRHLSLVGSGPANDG